MISWKKGDIIWYNRFGFKACRMIVSDVETIGHTTTFTLKPVDGRWEQQEIEIDDHEYALRNMVG